MQQSSGAPAPARRPPTRGVFGGGAWRIGEVAGIELAVDHTWVLIFALITFSLGTQFTAQQEGWSRPTIWLAATSTSLLFFASIVLHELGHSLVAQRFGLRVRAITLFVFGGVAQLESEPKRPSDEVWIALAGPAVSFALAFGFDAASSVAVSEGIASTMFGWLGRINLFLAIFNLVPGFPLDGGRVLRGLVWASTGSFVRATRIAARSGSFIAYLMMGLGVLSALTTGSLLSGLWLVFIGWFLLSAARASVSQLVVEHILAGRRVLDLMEPVEGARVAAHVSVADLAHDAVLRRGTRTFYVVDERDRLLGLVTLAELAHIDPEQRASTRAEQVMVPAGELVALSPNASGFDALRQMAETHVNQLPVVQDGRLLGTVTREHLMALIQGALVLGEGRGVI